MRIAVGGMSHETNTFTDLKTPLSAFQVVEGDAIFTISDAVANTSLEGIIEVLQKADVTIIPTLYAQTLPSGPIEKGAYDDLKRRLLKGMQDAGKLDAVVLAMHGSMFIDKLGDGDGDLLQAVRDTVGSDVPIFCAFDLHATVTQQIIDNVNGIVGYRTAPHVDVEATGRKAAELALAALKGELDVATTWVNIPMLVSGEQSETKAPPMTEIIPELVHLPLDGDILSSSVFLGFPWADLPYNCVSSLVVSTKEALPTAHEEARRLAQLVWSNRHQFVFTTEAHSMEECLDKAQEERDLGKSELPIIIADSGDNPTAGASQDLTYALDVLVKKGIKNALFAVVFDQQAYQKCEAVGVGATIGLQLGRVNPDCKVPRPLEITAQVEKIGHGKGIKSAVIKVDDITVIVTEKRTDVFDPKFLTDLGLRPKDYDVIVVKSGYLSPAYAALTERPMLALTPGDTNLVLESLPYKVTPRPIHPLDKDFHWQPQ
ncbi:MAG: M81 family metallopeptidase [Firmicutes bacterium]|nr:M81 family metallopeptidase [Bacillota bacterium]